MIAGRTGKPATEVAPEITKSAFHDLRGLSEPAQAGFENTGATSAGILGAITPKGVPTLKVAIDARGISRQPEAEKEKETRGKDRMAGEDDCGPDRKAGDRGRA